MALATQPVVIQLRDSSYYVFDWKNLDEDDDGATIKVPGLTNKTVHVYGNFGTGGQVNIQGSNDGGATWVLLTDPQGNALTFLSAAMKYITETPELIRPFCDAGTSVSISVTIVATA